jgi:hypothetical protein
MQRLAYAAFIALALSGCNNAANDTRSAVGPDGDVLMEIKTPIQTGDLPPQRGPQAAEEATTHGATSGSASAGTLSGGTASTSANAQTASAAHEGAKAKP